VATIRNVARYLRHERDGDHFYACGHKEKKEKRIISIKNRRDKTLRLLSSLPLSALISVLFPEEGGPRRRVILKITCTSNIYFSRFLYIYKKLITKAVS
jgi:hypothetical protein